MHIVITGGAGFLGLRLARALLHRGELRLAGTPAQRITRLSLVDRVTPPVDLLDQGVVRSVIGDLVTLLQQSPDQVVPPETVAVVHLAAAVSGECEADLDLGLRSNLLATQLLLQRCRALASAPVVVFSSSLAVYGGTPEQPLPDVIADTTLPTPQNSYGIQKFMGEQLMADFTRRGHIQGRNVRLMTVSVRPGRPNAAASGFLSGMVREPLAGLTGVCPVAPDTPVALASPQRSIEGLICAMETASRDWGPRTAMNLPALTTTPAHMAAALEKVAGRAVANLIDWRPDARIADIVTRWPSRLDATRAQALGLRADPDFESIVREYLRENPDAVKRH